MKHNSNSFVRLSSEYLMGGYTAVDNIFICELLKNASENDVKVYLYGLYLAHSGVDCDISTIKSYLGLSDEEVLNAFYSLQDLGVVDIISVSPISVVFQPISNSPIKPRKIAPGKYDSFNKELQSILSERMLSVNEYTECYNVLELYHVQPEAFLLIASYCARQKGKNVSPKYILATVKNFAYKNITTIKGVEKELADYELQTSDIADVIKKLGLKKKVELDDSNLYKKWLNLGFDKKAILAAASCLKKEKASIAKLDAYLLELFSFKKFSEKEILDFDKSKKDMRDLAIEINNSLGVFVQYLDPEISTYIVKWISLGFDRDVLIKIAEYCFAHDLRSLAKMDETVGKFAKIGAFTLNAYNEFFAELLAKDQIIARTLDAIGLDRKVNNYDRKQYSIFEKMGFTPDMIEYAGSLASSSKAPYAYMTTIFNSWKAKGITTIAAAKNEKVNLNNNTENIISHNYTKEELNSSYISIDDLDF